MNTSTKDITLSPGINENGLSPECISTLIDLWSTLSTTAVEAAQVPDCNMFSFAENCFFFAVILEDKKTDVNAIDDVQSRLGDGEVGGASYTPNQPKNGVTNKDLQSPRILPSWENIPSSFPISNSVKQQADTVDEDIYILPHQMNDGSPGNLWGEAPQNSKTTATAEDPWDFSMNDVESPPFQTTATPIRDHSLQPYKKAIGVVYLTTSPHDHALTTSGSNIGVVLVPTARGKGYARQAIELVLNWGFQEIGFHRIQAIILDTPNKSRAFLLFTQMGFVHEGIRRRSVYVPNEGQTDGEWRDATCFALLETEWLMRSYFKPAPKNLWDEMFARHSRERDELLRWDEKENGIKRTSSMETIRLFGVAASDTASVAASENDASSVFSGESSVSPSKRRKIENDPFEDQSPAPSPPPSDYESSTSSWASGGVRLPHSPFSHIPRGSAMAMARDDDHQSDASTSFAQYASPVLQASSPADSQWDMLSASGSDPLSLDSTGFTSEED